MPLVLVVPRGGLTATLAAQPICSLCHAPMAATCATCAGPACAACDLCHGCRRILCDRCEQGPGPAYLAPGDIWAHPHGSRPMVARVPVADS